MEFKEFLPIIVRGIKLRCPCCGEGKLFSNYLKQVNNCALCGESYSNIHADDGPAWLTILIVGHLLAPLIIMFSSSTNWPDFMSIIVWSILAIVLVILILPIAKGAFVAIIWKLNSKRK